LFAVKGGVEWKHNLYLKKLCMRLIQRSRGEDEKKEL
jgi:hypothetical protein